MVGEGGAVIMVHSRGEALTDRIHLHKSGFSWVFSQMHATMSFSREHEP